MTEDIKQFSERLSNAVKALETDNALKKAAEQLISLIVKVEERQVKRLDEKTSAELTALKTDLTIFAQKLEDKVAASIKGIEGKASKAESTFISKVQELDKRISELKDGEDADEESMMARMMTELQSHMKEMEPMITEQIEKDLPQLGTATRDGLELIQDEDEKLKIAAIGHLEERLKKLEERPLGRFGGGGTSQIGVQFALSSLVKTETPSGLINSSNVTYQTTQTINVVFSFAINGMFLHQGTDFTYSGNTITMLAALDSALSGTSFTIIYC